MKIKILMMALISQIAFFSQNSFASRVGNGGGAWVCKEIGSPEVIKWAELVDLFEAKNEFNLNVPPRLSESYQDILEIIKARLLHADHNLLTALNSYFEQVQKNIVFVTADLEIINDALYRVKPATRTCANGTISYMQLANYTNYGKILVQSDLFQSQSLSEVSKAAMLFHEVLYTYLRENLGDENSVRTRLMVGLIFSDLPAIELGERIKNALKVSFGDVRLPKRFSGGLFDSGERWATDFNLSENGTVLTLQKYVVHPIYREHVEITFREERDKITTYRRIDGTNRFAEDRYARYTLEIMADGSIILYDERVKKVISKYHHLGPSKFVAALLFSASCESSDNTKLFETNCSMAAACAQNAVLRKCRTTYDPLSCESNMTISKPKSAPDYGKTACVVDTVVKIKESLPPFIKMGHL